MTLMLMPLAMPKQKPEVFLSRRRAVCVRQGRRWASTQE